MSGDRSLDHNVLSMDGSACQFLGDDDMLGSHADAFHLLGPSGMVEGPEVRFQRHCHRRRIGCHPLGHILAWRILFDTSLRLRPSSGRFHLRHEGRGKSLGAVGPDASHHRSGRGNFLARMHSEHAFKPLEPQFRLHRHDSGLWTCPSVQVQFHADHGCHGGGIHLGTRLPFLP